MAQVGLEVMPVSRLWLHTNGNSFLKNHHWHLWSCLLPLVWPYCGVTSHLFSLYSLFAQLFTLMFCKRETFSLSYFMSKKNTNKQEMMTFAVHLSLLICSPGNKFAEGQFCLRAVHCVWVIFINVNHHLLGVSHASSSPLRPRCTANPAA